jgi:hypothetical protein
MEAADLIRKRLADLIEQAKTRASGVPAVTGSDDCVMWIASIYRDAFGKDPARRYRGRYSSVEEAALLMKHRGIGPTVMRVVRRLRWVRIQPSNALVGDFALIDVAGEVNAAIFDAQLWIRRIDGGYGGYPAEFVRKAWRVT